MGSLFLYIAAKLIRSLGVLHTGEGARRPPIAHKSKAKTMLLQNEGLPLDRDPAWATYL